MSDISHISDTALWVAMFRAIESERPDALFHDPFARLLAGDKGEDIIRNMPYPKLMQWVMAIRTVALDRLILSAIKDGVDTVINLGAGLDTRPYRMPLPPDLNWIEVDFPDLITMKTERLRGKKPICKLRLVGLDLSKRDLRQKFLTDISARAGRIAVLTEGVIMYLDANDVRELAQDLFRTPKLEYWIQDYRHGGYSLAMGLKMKEALKKVPFRFKVDDWFEFFKEQGWVVDENITSWQEGKRVGRRFPYMSFVNFSHLFMSRSRRERLRNSSGYVKFKRAGSAAVASGGSLREGIDFTIENGLHVFSETYLQKRGCCCDSGCRNCPY